MHLFYLVQYSSLHMTLNEVYLCFGISPYITKHVEKEDNRFQHTKRVCVRAEEVEELISPTCRGSM